MTKLDALMEAKTLARQNGYAFAIETIHGWAVADRKPSLRYGKVIEVAEDGREYHA